MSELPLSPDPRSGRKRAKPIDTQVERFLRAVRDGKAAAARRLLNSYPEIAGANAFTAAAAGRPDLLAEIIRADARAALATHGPDEWPPLAFACRSPFHRISERHAEQLREAANLLLSAGASPNSGSVWRGGDGAKAPISVLYHACMSNHVALVELLLERGARTDDGESIYHAAQHNRRACLERLVAHGADLSSRQEPYGNTPLYFLVGHDSDDEGRAPWFKGLVWLLAHGADPNVPSYTSGEAPLHGLAAGRPKLATLKQLLAHGADVNLPRADGRTPYRIAVRHGNAAIASLLLEHGAEPSGLLPIEEFLGACLAADAGRARAILASHPALPAAMTGEDRAAMVDAVRQDSASAIRLMVALGFQLDWEDTGGGTALHSAAWLGKPELVRVLIELGAPINLRDSRFGCSPLAWAAHSSQFQHDDERYRAIIDLLIDAGSLREATVNRWGESMTGSRRVLKHLEERGFA